ncbi:MAG: riboflavin biosynthesis protein RibF [Bacteroidales bacterium]|nr:riboflavin biosynthesis protein RibF [Bacteroidales bacterium]
METYNIDNISHLGGNCMATVGMFDGVHAGHRHIIERLNTEAGRRGLEPVVVTFDTHPRIVLGKADGGFALLSTADERCRLLADAGVRNMLQLHFSADLARLSACEFLRSVLVEKLGVCALLTGYDNQFGNRAAADFDRLPEEARQLGVELLTDSAVLVGGLEVSSTRVRHALVEGNVELAAALLGRRYAATGSVVLGRQVGRTMGFPTANIELPDRLKALPANGVYAAVATAGAKSYPAMANIGAQPTFGQTTTAFEVHLIGFEGDLYGQQLTVQFVRRLRPIRRFGSADELRQQLKTDLTNTLLCTNS